MARVYLGLFVRCQSVCACVCVVKICFFFLVFENWVNFCCLCVSRSLATSVWGLGPRLGLGPGPTPISFRRGGSCPKIS